MTKPSGPKSTARRSYQSRLRADQAIQTRARLLQAAGECFAEHGYAGTTLRQIAERAGVSVETVQLNGPKSGLLLAAYEQAFSGSEGQDSLLERPSFKAVLDAPDVERALDAVVEFFTSASAQSSRLSAAFEAAALSDPKVDEARRGLRERSRADAVRGIDFFAALGGVTSGRPREDLVDELWYIVRSSHYLTLVEEIGWPVDRYKEWLRRQLRAIVL